MTSKSKNYHGLGAMPWVPLPCLRRGPFKAENMRSGRTRRWLVWGFTPRSLGSAIRYDEILARLPICAIGVMVALLPSF